MKTTTPAAVTANIAHACRTIAPGTPVYLPSIPETDSRPSWCFDNVAKKVARDGGRIVHGWVIWHVPGLYVEAEHHGVWESLEGVLIDVSPQFMDARTILFLRDEARHYDGDRPLANRLFPDAETDVSQDFVRLAQERVDIENSYRIGAPDTIIFTDSDQARVDEIDCRLRELRAIHAG